MTRIFGTHLFDSRNFRLMRIVFLAFLVVSASAISALAAQPLKITEKTKTYSIKGQTAAQFAASMTSRGPYSRQLRRRVWASATRSLSFRMNYRRTSGSCTNRGARVDMDIVYRMPRLASKSGVPRSQLRKWQRMYAILLTHERVHGRYYKQLARQVHKALARKRTAKNCSDIDRWAKALVKKMSAANVRKNLRFETRDRPNFLKMRRIYQGT
ncbi:MAG: DUF922 domain-containing protein [Pseudomonadota bacterium]